MHILSLCQDLLLHIFWLCIDDTRGYVLVLRSVNRLLLVCRTWRNLLLNDSSKSLWVHIYSKLLNRDYRDTICTYDRLHNFISFDDHEYPDHLHMDENLASHCGDWIVSSKFYVLPNHERIPHDINKQYHTSGNYLGVYIHKAIEVYQLRHPSKNPIEYLFTFDLTNDFYIQCRIISYRAGVARLMWYPRRNSICYFGSDQFEIERGCCQEIPGLIVGYNFIDGVYRDFRVFDLDENEIIDLESIRPSIGPVLVTPERMIITTDYLNCLVGYSVDGKTLWTCPLSPGKDYLKKYLGCGLAIVTSSKREIVIDVMTGVTVKLIDGHRIYKRYIAYPDWDKPGIVLM